ncbi:uncharacterized protein [Argopecten irradians]|uniref:uncharacterized protein n=1 Tax=Argopecten irradians TaxID=31199 RepID=UPI003716AF58
MSAVGCGKMKSIDVKEFSYGWSYNMCLASGIYVIILPVLVCCGVCCSRDDGDCCSENKTNQREQAQYRPQQTTVATTSTSGELCQQQVAVAMVEREEISMSGSVVAFSNIRVMRIFRMSLKRNN